MTDLASLLVKVDSTQVKDGVRELDKLTAAGKQAEAQTGKIRASHAMAAKSVAGLARHFGELGQSSRTATGQASKMIAQTMGVGHASGLARHHLQNLTFQVNDLAMGLASGQSPMRVFIQQGSQIAQIGQQAGVGLGGMAKAVLRMLAPFSAVAALAGGVGAAFMGVKRGAEAADPAAQKLISTLGLTKDEIEKLEDTSVTWGDTLGATFDVLAKRAGTSSAEVKTAWGNALDLLGEFGKHSVASLIAGFGGLVQFVASAGQNIGVLLAKGIEFGVNKALEFIERLINGVAAGLNKVAGFLGSMGINVGSVGTVSLGRVVASGSLTNPLSDAAGRFKSTYGDVMGGFDAIGAGARKRRDNRVTDQARDLIEDRNGVGRKAREGRERAKQLSEEEKAALSAAKAAEAYVESLRKETDGIGKNALELKRMEVATEAAAARQAAAAAPTKDLKDRLLAQADAIAKAGAAWEKVYKDDQLAQFIKNTVEPLERQASMIGLTAEQQARANLEFEKAAIIAEHGAAAWERYAAAQGKIIADQFKVKNPLEEWAEQFKPDEMIRSLQEIQVRGLDGLSSAITDVITGTQSLKGAFKDLARSIIADIVQMTVRMLIFRAVSSAFPGLFGGGISETGANPVGGAIGMASGGSFEIFGRGGTDKNLLSLNGQPLARVSRGETGLIMPKGRPASPTSPSSVNLTVNVHARDAVLTSSVKGWIAEGIAEAAPHIVRSAGQHTIRSLGRARLNN